MRYSADSCSILQLDSDPRRNVVLFHPMAQYNIQGARSKNGPHIHIVTFLTRTNRWKRKQLIQRSAGYPKARPRSRDSRAVSPISHSPPLSPSLSLSFSIFISFARPRFSRLRSFFQGPSNKIPPMYIDSIGICFLPLRPLSPKYDL